MDETVLFAPSRLDTAVTPDEVDKAIASHSYAQAINMAVLLGTKSVLKRAVDAVDRDSIELVPKAIDSASLGGLMCFLAEEIVRYTLMLLYVRKKVDLNVLLEIDGVSPH